MPWLTVTSGHEACASRGRRLAVDISRATPAPDALRTRAGARSVVCDPALLPRPSTSDVITDMLTQSVASGLWRHSYQSRIQMRGTKSHPSSAAGRLVVVVFVIESLSGPADVISQFADFHTNNDCNRNSADCFKVSAEHWCLFASFVLGVVMLTVHT